MHAIDTLRPKKLIFIVFFVIGGAFALAACGTNNTGTATTPAPTPTPGIVRGYGSAYGCPSDVVVSAVPTAANVIVRTGLGHTSFSVQKGDVMEVQMPFGIAWKGPDLFGRVLQQQSPAGYVWKPSNACVWRYVASDAGTVKLTFFGSALCKKNLLCVPAETITEFTIKVA